jgi:hypothetical protein
MTNPAKPAWVNEAIMPIAKIADEGRRVLDDFPPFISPGARQVGQLTAIRAVHADTYVPAMQALEVLANLEDWSHGFLIAEDVRFNWRTAPLRHYASFKDFYERELEPTWGKWDELRKNYRKVVYQEDRVPVDATPLQRAWEAASAEERAEFLAALRSQEATPKLEADG